MTLDTWPARCLVVPARRVWKVATIPYLGLPRLASRVQGGLFYRGSDLMCFN